MKELISHLQCLQWGSWDEALITVFLIFNTILQNKTYFHHSNNAASPKHLKGATRELPDTKLET